MSTDLLTDLAEYGHHHREAQPPVTPVEAAQHALTPALAPAPPNYAMRRAGAALVAGLLVILLISIPALLRGPESEGPADSAAATTPVDVTSTLGATTVPGAESTPAELEFEGFVMLHSLRDDSLVGLKDGTVWRSTDDGQNWKPWYEQSHEIDLLAVAPDGAVLAVRNPNSTSAALGEGSTVNDTPQVHRFDEATSEWSIIDLPRPDLPGESRGAVSTLVDATECPLGGIQSWVDGNAVVVGERIAILGDHRVVADGICDEDFQFLWTSPDGMEWSIVPSIGIDGYLAGISWFQDSYIGFGSSRPFYVGGGGPTPQVWSSADLDMWVERTPGPSSMPSDGFIQAGSIGQASFVGNLPVGSTTTDEQLAVSFQVFRDRPGLDSIESSQQLEEWLNDAGLPPQSDPSLEELLDSTGLDFPLDQDEVDELVALFGVQEAYGTLTLWTSDGIEWETEYTAPD